MGVAIEQAAEMEPIEEPQLPETVPEPEGEPVWKQILTAQTGDGRIEDYVDHPMNFTHEIGLAQVIRGLTGMLGNLSLAVVDVGFGLLRILMSRRQQAQQPVAEHAS